MVKVKAVLRRDHMNLEYASGVTVPKNRRKIMRLIDLVHKDGQVRLTASERAFESGESFGIHGDEGGEDPPLRIEEASFILHGCSG